eukprot:6786653-Lingulodinium_polyedra.AAC.1
MGNKLNATGNSITTNPKKSPKTTRGNTTSNPGPTNGGRGRPPRQPGPHGQTKTRHALPAT